MASTRLEDARILLSQGRYSAAFYLVGYSVECALKACIAKQTREFEFPDQKRVNNSWTHKLSQLMELADIQQMNALDSNAMLKSNWIHVSNKWSESARYEVVSEIEARVIVAAVDDLHHGVMQWLQKHW